MERMHVREESEETREKQENEKTRKTETIWILREEGLRNVGAQSVRRVLVTIDLCQRLLTKSHGP